MADSRKTVQIKSDPIGDVRIADEVVAIIAGHPRWDLILSELFFCYQP